MEADDDFSPQDCTSPPGGGDRTDAAQFPSPGPAELAMSPCWRCRLDAPADAQACPHCGARLTAVSASPASFRGRPVPALRGEKNHAARLILIAYGLILATGVVHGWVLQLRFEHADLGDAGVYGSVLRQVAFVEAIDAAITLTTLALAWRWLRPNPDSWLRGIWAWPAFAPVFVGLMLLNLCYHDLLLRYVRWPQVERDLFSQWSWTAFATVCVQPAIVEELFFRRLALPWLRTLVGVHGAVWISALMFGMSHVAVLLSIPYLIVVGAVFGYAATTSGRIYLPIALHFFHNLVVMWYESST